MSYRRIKNKDKLVAAWKLKSAKRYYYDVFLWEDQESFDENTNDNDPGVAAGCVNFAPLRLLISGKDGSVLKKVIPKKMGEVHFIKGKWDMEIVAHELCHALIGRLRHNTTLKLCDVIQQNNGAEETIQEGIDKAIKRKIDEINHYIAEGWEKEKAIKYAKDSSSLGPTSWSKVLQGIR